MRACRHGVAFCEDCHNEPTYELDPPSEKNFHGIDCPLTVAEEKEMAGVLREFMNHNGDTALLRRGEELCDKVLGKEKRETEYENNSAGD